MQTAIKEMAVSIVSELLAVCPNGHAPLEDLKQRILDAPAEEVCAYIDGPMQTHQVPITNRNVEYFFADGQDDEGLAALRLRDIREFITQEVAERALSTICQMTMVQKTSSFMPQGFMEGIQEAAKKVMSSSSDGQINTEALAQVTGELMASLGFGNMAQAPATPEERQARLKDMRRKLI